MKRVAVAPDGTLAVLLLNIGLDVANGEGAGDGAVADTSVATCCDAGSDVGIDPSFRRLIAAALASFAVDAVDAPTLDLGFSVTVGRTVAGLLNRAMDIDGDIDTNGVMGVVDDVTDIDGVMGVEDDATGIDDVVCTADVVCIADVECTADVVCIADVECTADVVCIVDVVGIGDVTTADDVTGGGAVIDVAAFAETSTCCLESLLVATIFTPTLVSFLLLFPLLLLLLPEAAVPNGSTHGDGSESVSRKRVKKKGQRKIPGSLQSHGCIFHIKKEKVAGINSSTKPSHHQLGHTTLPCINPPRKHHIANAATTTHCCTGNTFTSRYKHVRVPGLNVKQLLSEAALAAVLY